MVHQYKAFLMWLFPLFFFAYQFILRLWPGLMMQPLMAQFSIDAGSFGLLAASYYYGYAGMQIPIAILLQRYGARTIISTFAVLCGLAMLLFSSTNNFYLALFSRFLIGAGSAVGFLGVSQVVSEWFKKEHYANMIGLSFTFGLLGAVYGGKPLSLLLSHYDSHFIALALSLFSIFIAFAVVLVLRKPSDLENNQANSLKIANLKSLLSSKSIWLLAIANLLMVGALEGFADVWGVSYLMQAYSFNKADAALLCSFIYIGMLFGGPLLALLAKRVGNFKVLGGCGLGLALMFSLLLSNCLGNWLTLCTLFFTIGLLCCYQVIVFAAGSRLVNPALLGITVAFLNCINMLGGSFFHTLIGKLMDGFWTGTVDGQGLKIYSLATFQYALSLIPVCAVLGALGIYCLQRKTAQKELQANMLVKNGYQT
ncbi:MFS transporter [Legionella sp. km772]|uniref:MFS transporter n=1 Tax=Legionella sp. km772 TaxID=2498111 RepID=UPI000F8EDA1F|nr:MFS transporter [Legionella sp. km772]RUR13111.1 MFS transporter [Legionella sp. km772]